MILVHVCVWKANTWCWTWEDEWVNFSFEGWEVKGFAVNTTKFSQEKKRKRISTPETIFWFLMNFFIHYNENSLRFSVEWFQFILSHGARVRMTGLGESHFSDIKIHKASLWCTAYFMDVNFYCCWLSFRLAT